MKKLSKEEKLMQFIIQNTHSPTTREYMRKQSGKKYQKRYKAAYKEGSIDEDRILSHGITMRSARTRRYENVLWGVGIIGLMLAVIIAIAFHDEGNTTGDTTGIDPSLQSTM